MGCFSSKAFAHEQPKLKPKPEMSIVERPVTRGSSVEQLSERPRSPSSISTKVDVEYILPSGGAPILPRVDCIAPRPKRSEESLRRRKGDDDQAHQGSATTSSAVVGGAMAGAAVHADDGFGASVGDAGSGGDGGDGGGGD